MMFPLWVQKARSKKAQATARLKYILYRLAIEQAGTPTIRGLCEGIDFANHATVSLYVKKGAFSHRMAEAFEEHFGSDAVTAAQLTDPLSIPADTAR